MIILQGVSDVVGASRDNSNPGIVIDGIGTRAAQVRARRDGDTYFF